MQKSIKRKQVRKSNQPDKPYDGFPLFAHATGRWAKKVKGKIRFYGRWGRNIRGTIVPVDDVKQSAADAKTELDRCWPYHSQGREAPDASASSDYLTVESLANRFIDSKNSKLESGDLSELTFDDYFRICQSLVDHFGKDKRVAQSISHQLLFDTANASLTADWNPSRTT